MEVLILILVVLGILASPYSSGVIFLITSAFLPITRSTLVGSTSFFLNLLTNGLVINKEIILTTINTNSCIKKLSTNIANNIEKNAPIANQMETKLTVDISTNIKNKHAANQ